MINFTIATQSSKNHKIDYKLFCNSLHMAKYFRLAPHKSERSYYEFYESIKIFKTTIFAS